MKTLSWLALLAAFAVGCVSEDSSSDSIQVKNGIEPTIVPPREPPPVCAVRRPGEVLVDVPIVGGKQVAVDAMGNMFFVAERGIVKLDASGKQVFAFPFGQVLAVDARGDVFVAFTIDAPVVIHGETFCPIGSANVMLVELDRNGRVVMAKLLDLGLKASSVLSIAVDSTGRIALSANGPGTFVLDASGSILMHEPFTAFVAFDSHDNLVVAGNIAGTGSIEIAPNRFVTASGGNEFFVAKYDSRLGLLFDFVVGDRAENIPLSLQAVAGLAVGPGDAIAIVGYFHTSISLFGREFLVPDKSPFGAQFGSFVVKLDASGAVIFATEMSPISATAAIGGVAIDAFGRVLVSTNFPASVSPLFESPAVVDLNGTLGLPILSMNFSVSGFGLGVAADACGNIAFADFEGQLGARLRLITP